ncbi:MAG: magnesium transporter [Spirochaetes bacterium]|nr:MAG: magnesium transporter [Spirochaetota bacterium]
MYGSLLQPEIEELIRTRNFSLLKEIFRDWSPEDLAELISDIPQSDRLIVFRLLPKALLADTFEHIPLDIQKELLENIGKGQITSILNEMSPDDRTALLEELPPAFVTRILSLLSKDEREIARTLLGYPEDSIGRIMTTDYVAVRQNMTVKQVLSFIRRHGSDSETLNMIYVVDEKGKLIDELSIRRILIAAPNKKVSSIMDRKFIALEATMPEEEAIGQFKKYDLYAIPVVDSGGYLVGIVTMDDILDVAEKEDTEDIHKMGGVEALEDPYLNTPILSLTRKRATWLVILFLGELLTATAMGYFEKEIARAVVLALFIPLIISSGGNSGSQASTLVIRAMAVGEVKLRDFGRVFLRELMSGTILGGILGLIGFTRIAIWQQFMDIYGPHWMQVGITVGFALVGVVLWGTLAGSMLPFILRRVGVDPATSSAPFVATLVDVSGLVIYFSIASLLLSGTVL